MTRLARTGMLFMSDRMNMFFVAKDLLAGVGIVATVPKRSLK